MSERIQMKRVLIVDNEIDTAEALHSLLEEEGYACTIATSGRDAIAAMELQKPDLVLLDLMMPGMSGIDVLCWMRGTGNLSDTPVVLATAAKPPSEEEKLGWKHVLKKPFDIGDLLKLLHELVPQ